MAAAIIFDDVGGTPVAPRIVLDVSMRFMCDKDQSSESFWQAQYLVKLMPYFVVRSSTEEYLAIRSDTF